MDWKHDDQLYKVEFEEDRATAEFEGDIFLANFEERGDTWHLTTIEAYFL